MYRDRPPMCPHCGIELVRPSERPWWRCAKCEGTLVTVAAVVRALLSVDADLLEDHEIRDLDTEPRESLTTIPCPLCASALEPVLLHGTELERCRQDEVLWFDDWEYIAMLAGAKDEVDSKSLPRRLARWLRS